MLKIETAKEQRLFDLLRRTETERQALITTKQICHYDTFDPPQYVPGLEREVGKGIYDFFIDTLTKKQVKSEA